MKISGKMLAVFFLVALMGFAPVPEVEGLLYNTWSGLATDISVNPLGVLAAIVLKKIVLWKLGFGIAGLGGIGKRSIDTSAITPLPIDETLSPSKDEYEKLANQLDVNGCVARLVCETVASGREDTKMEKAILQYYREHIVGDGTTTTAPPPGRSIFHYAAFMGSMARGSQSCGALFKECQRSSTEVKKMATLVFDLDL